MTRKGTVEMKDILHEDCQDSTDDSPHGHVAFYIDVP
jgi:hypothetical protein